MNNRPLLHFNYLIICLTLLCVRAVTVLLAGQPETTGLDSTRYIHIVSHTDRFLTPICSLLMHTVHLYQ